MTLIRTTGLAVLALAMLASASTAATPAPRKAARTPAARTSAGDPSRRIEETHIAGEVPVPQVMFITVRSPRRDFAFHHRRYWRTSLEIGASTPLPSWIAVTHIEPEPQTTPAAPSH